jgi:hypothetical protein
MFHRLALAAALVLAVGPAAAQEEPNPMIVFDGSGSMRGQIDGEARIETARRALSRVLSEASPAMRIGMLAHGHRTRGPCDDIETMVPIAPAVDTVPRIIAAADGMTRRGMAPLSDTVTIAAEGMGFTEQSATVVRVTDGIETCGGDPCALGRVLAARGVAFRADVVGFDMSDEEQRQVSCLAEETRGLFLAANDAGTPAAALAKTLSATPMPLPEPPPPPVVAAREVRIVLRDVAGGEVLTGRPFTAMDFLPADVVAHQGGDRLPGLRFTGTWAGGEGRMLPVQDGRRVWGEVYHPALADAALAPWFAQVRDPDPVPAPVPADMPVIGGIDTLPDGGIYAMLPSRAGESVEAAFARLFDGSADATLAEACATRPIVLHEDGLIAERIRDKASAEAGGPAFRTERYQRCEQSGPLAFCSVFARPLSPGAAEPDFDYRAEVVGGPMGSFGLRDTDLGAMAMYRDCRGDPGRFLDPMARLPDGRLIVDELLRREDRDTGRAPPQDPAPAIPQEPVPVPGAIDFAALQGAYGEVGDLASSCRNDPGYLHADGELVTWGGNWTGGQPLARMSCAPDGGCAVLAFDGDPSEIPADLRLEPAGETLRLCTGGACDVTLASCAGLLDPAEIAAMARRGWAESPAAGLDFTALGGHWAQIRAEELAYACSDGGLYVHPDGTAVAWDDPGTGLEHVLTLSCKTDGRCIVSAYGTQSPPAPAMRLQSRGPDSMQICFDDDCSLELMRCRGAVLPPSRSETMARIPGR